MKISEAVIFANDRPMQLNDDLYQWAVDADEMIRKQYEVMKTTVAELRYLSATTTGRVKGVIDKLLDEIIQEATQ